MTTSIPLHPMPLVAQRDAWESLGARFSGEHAQLHWGDLWALLGVMLVGAVFVLMLRWLYRLQQARLNSNDPRHLFADLCRAHRLGRKQRRLLEELAESAALTQPALVFVRADLFEEGQLVVPSEKEAEAYRQLTTRLFAGLEALTATAAKQSGSESPKSTAEGVAVVSVAALSPVGDANAAAPS